MIFLFDNRINPKRRSDEVINKKTWFTMLALLVVFAVGCSKSDYIEEPQENRPIEENSIKEEIPESPVSEAPEKEVNSLVSEEDEAREKAEANSKTETTPPKEGNTEPSSKSENSAYKAIFDEYSEKLREATPKLAQEYIKEAKDNQKGIEGLAAIYYSKVEDLAAISYAGTEKLAEALMENSSGKYEEYEDWGKQLYSVYEEEANKLYKEYSKSINN